MKKAKRIGSNLFSATRTSLVVCLVAFCFSACGDGSGSSQNPANSSPSSVSSSPDSVMPSFLRPDSSSPEMDTEQIGFDKTVSTGTVDFILKEGKLFEEVMPENPNTYYFYLPDNPSEKYLVFYASVTNTSRDSISLDALKSQISLDGYNYNGATYYDSETGISEFFYSIKPLAEQEILLIFSVPDDIAFAQGELYIGLNEDMSGYYFDDIEDMDYRYSMPFQFER